jgi:hypothetical protein
MKHEKNVDDWTAREVIFLMFLIVLEFALIMYAIC